MNRKRNRGVRFIVRWKIQTTVKHRRVYLFRSKTFDGDDHKKMKRFYASKAREFGGIDRVWIEKIDGRGVRMDKPPRRVRREIVNQNPRMGCGPTLAANIEQEDFGSFAGIPG